MTLTMGFGCNCKTPVLLHTILTLFIHQAKTDIYQLDARCSHCLGLNKVQGLKMPSIPWIWLKWDQHSPVGPSLALTFCSQSFQLNYSLWVVIYSCGGHFTICFHEQLDRWRTHDGQVALGVPQPDNIQSKVDLLMNGTHFACISSYHHDDH